MKILKILLAEDNGADVLLVREALEEHGIKHELHVVQDGAEAISWVSQIGLPGCTGCPDLLLLDLNLPKVDGFEILQAFRKRRECSETPVIVVTSSNSPKDRARTAALGVNYYFTKPTDFNEFMKLGGLVQQVLQSMGG
jgi:chemotaxis family two-component system response regulator Rcp1